MGPDGRDSNANHQQVLDYKPITKTRENGVFGDGWEVEQKKLCRLMCSLLGLMITVVITSRWAVGLRTSFVRFQTPEAFLSAVIRKIREIRVL